MSYTPGEFIALEAELIVALEHAKACIEDVTASLPPEEN